MYSVKIISASAAQIFIVTRNNGEGKTHCARRISCLNISRTRKCCYQNYREWPMTATKFAFVLASSSARVVVVLARNVWENRSTKTLSTTEHIWSDTAPSIVGERERENESSIVNMWMVYCASCCIIMCVRWGTVTLRCLNIHTHTLSSTHLNTCCVFPPSIYWYYSTHNTNHNKYTYDRWRCPLLSRIWWVT